MGSRALASASNIANANWTKNLPNPAGHPAGLFVGRVKANNPYSGNLFRERALPSAKA